MPERFIWAANVLDVQPADTLLEIGCGTGLLASLLLPELGKGHYTAIDRSATAIAKATGKHESYVASGKARFITGTLSNATLKPKSYNKIFAFNVANLWKAPATELDSIRKLLKRGGSFYLFHQPPYDITKQMAAEATQVLQEHGFEIRETIIRQLETVPAFCMVAQPI